VLLFQALSAREPVAAATAHPPRLGYIRELFIERQQPGMTAMLAAVAQRLADAGAAMEQIDPPERFEVALQAHQVIMLAEAATYHLREHGDQLPLYGPRIRSMVEAGATIPATVYLDAQRVRQDLAERVRPLFERFDALLVPAAAGGAPEGLAFTGDTSFNGPWTLLGLPAITLPGGRDERGLPLGLQLVGAPLQDEGLLATAAWCEQRLEPVPAPPDPYR
jgi:Asp-tRNA(Asn)/Glu-tRNA(Gln) amidotransferase A subunit family amidase